MKPRDTTRETLAAPSSTSGDAGPGNHTPSWLQSEDAPRVAADEPELAWLHRSETPAAGPSAPTRLPWMTTRAAPEPMAPPPSSLAQRIDEALRREEAAAEAPAPAWPQTETGPFAGLTDASLQSNSLAGQTARESDFSGFLRERERRAEPLPPMASDNAVAAGSVVPSPPTIPPGLKPNRRSTPSGEWSVTTRLADAPPARLEPPRPGHAFDALFPDAPPAEPRVSLSLAEEGADELLSQRQLEALVRSVAAEALTRVEAPPEEADLVEEDADEDDAGERPLAALRDALLPGAAKGASGTALLVSASVASETGSVAATTPGAPADVTAETAAPSATTLTVPAPSKPTPAPATTLDAAASVTAEAAAPALAAPAGPRPSLTPAVVSKPRRTYRLRDVQVLLGCFAATLALLDADGLLTWAHRLDVGPAQTAWLRALTPLRTVNETVGLTRPRRALVAAADQLGRTLGAGEDPLFAQAWRLHADTTALAPGPTPLAPVPAREEASDGDKGLVLEDIGEGPPAPDARATPPAAATAPVATASSDSPAPTATPENVEQPTVLLVGDSLLAGSLGNAIGRALAKDGRYRVVHAVQVATGLSRPDVFDWAQVVPQLLEREHPDFVIASFGANDATAMRVGERTVEFGDAEWKANYRFRVKQMMSALAGTSTTVLWLGMPPMREQRFAKRTRALNRVFASSARVTPRVQFLDVDALFGDEDGEFSTFTTDESGKYVRLRLDDGIHYSPAGAKLVSKKVLGWLHDTEKANAPAEHSRK